MLLRKINLLTALLLGLGVAAVMRAQVPQLMNPVTIQTDVSYSNMNHARQKLDLYLPAGNGPFPVIVWVHGGGWMSGDKAGCLPYRKGFTDKGYAVVSINYRLSSDALFPAQIVDCKTAIRWLRRNALQYKLDPERIAIWGGSAGGHLASLVGVTDSEFVSPEHPNQSSRVQAVIDFFGPADLVSMVKTPGFESHALPNSPESRLLGGPVLERMGAAISASPVTYITADDPPFFIAHGTADTTVPVQQSIQLGRTLREKQVPYFLKVIQDAGHGGYEFESEDIVSAIETFLGGM